MNAALSYTSEKIGKVQKHNITTSVYICCGRHMTTKCFLCELALRVWLRMFSH